MQHIVAAYWPFLTAALAVGIVIGWWSQDPHSVDDLTAWLERGPDEP